MKITLSPAGKSPDYYEFSGEMITAYYEGISEHYDLTVLPEGATLTSADPVNGAPAIRSAIRLNGELYVELCQQTGFGHWLGSEEFDATNYDPDTVYVSLNTERNYAGRAWAKTRQGKQYVDGVE